MIFPSRKLVLISRLSPEQTLDTVRRTLNPVRNWRERFDTSKGGGFTGTAENGRFFIQRDINYRNSFLPQVKGIIEPDPQGSGSRVTVTMAMHKFVQVFMCFWLFMVGAIGIPLAIAALNHKLQPPQNDWMGAVIPLVMLVFGLSLPHFGFWGEAKKAENFLTETLQAQLELPPDNNRAL